MSKQVKCQECVSHADSRLASLSQAILRTTDPYTAHHQERVGRIAMTLGQHMGCTDRQLQLLYHSGVVHDIGKIAVPMEILNKPFKLSKEEFDLIKTHVLHSVSILRSVDFCPEVCGIVAAHHERLDGSGYPNGLSSEQISIESRILTVADVFESMTSHRPYRASLGVEPALVELRTGKVTKYDPDVVSVLEEIVCHHDFNQIFGIDI